MWGLGVPGGLGREPERVHNLVTQAISSLLEWLSENWILAPGGREAVHRARVEVFKDWYGPYWSVNLTMEDAPWFGDSITIEVEELVSGDFRAFITEPQLFHRRNIQCLHGRYAPQGHWRVNPSPSPSPQVFSKEEALALPQPRLAPWPGSRRWPPCGENPCFAERSRDLGWADSRHWMEED